MNEVEELPPQVLRDCTRILSVGLMMIRMWGWDGRADLCAIEADHLHNLPSVLASPEHRLARLAYYYSAERPCYIAALARLDLAPSSEVEPLWLRLGDYLLSRGVRLEP